MELLMKNIHMCRRAKQVEKQVVLEEDLNVPDAKPDVEMIIQSREHVVVEHTRAETGKLVCGRVYGGRASFIRMIRRSTVCTVWKHGCHLRRRIVMEDLESGGGCAPAL